MQNGRKDTRHTFAEHAGSKKCVCCGYRKPLYRFRRFPASANSNTCNLCRSSGAAGRQLSANMRAWAKANPERAAAGERADNQRRLAARRGASGSDITKEAWSHVLAAFSNSCVYCDTTEHITQDHLVPIISGGEHVIHNVVPACGKCNSRKGTKDMRHWLNDEDRYQFICDTLGSLTQK